MNFVLLQILNVLLVSRIASSIIYERIDFSKTVTLEQVIKEEKALGRSVMPSPINVSLGYEYYPNLKGYDLQNPMVAEYETTEGLGSSTEYFFTPDSIVRVFLTTWYESFDFSKQPKKTTPEDLIANKFLFQDKITELQNVLIEQLGQPYVNAAHKPFNATSELMQYKWKGAFNADLSVVFSKDSGYSRLRLVVYRD
jgi:hypothetical protein